MSPRSELRGTKPTSIELACLHLLQDRDATYATVGRKLRISHNTVRRHLSNLYARYGVSSAAQAIRAVESD